MPDATQALAGHIRGNRAATDGLAAAVYAELRALAARSLQHERADHTLDSTALVHEAYLRLIDQTRVDWKSKAHFLAIASTTLRRVLVDHAKVREARRRGGGRHRITLSETMAAGSESLDILTLHEALGRLAELDPRRSQVVELRFFGGLSIDETAHVLNVSPRTVDDDWAVAKAWLFREIRKGDK
ncbi:MAG: ECF-type sigma factor [Planctomycetota bacterium]